MKKNQYFCQPLMVSIFLVILVLPSCSNLSPPIAPSRGKHTHIIQPVTKLRPAVESTSLGNLINHRPNITVTDNSSNKESGANTFSSHVAGIAVVEQTGQLDPTRELLFNHLNNAHNQAHPIKHKQPTRIRITRQGIPDKQQHSQSNLITLEQELPQTIFTTAEGYQLTLYKEETKWQAEVLEGHGSLSRTHQLDVYIEQGVNVELLRTANQGRAKQLIHVNLPTSKKTGYVYIGNWGLKGGGNNKVSSMPAIAGYQLLTCLHEGTSSNIYQAVCLSDQCPVSIKVSSQKILTEKKAQRFRQEFELGRKVDSPYVIRYLELKQDPTYGMALVMEDGQLVELDSIIPPSGFDTEEFLEFAIQITEGLQAIHSADIIHNDFKLSNILTQPATKTIKIIDFNRASTSRQERQSAIPIMVGTLAYISPEQTGRVNRSVDYRTDFYSLGVVLYRLLCGKLPFTAKDAVGLIHQHLAKQPLPPCQQKPTIPLLLSQLVMKLLEKEAENRYQSCEGILYDLRECLSALEETGTIPQFEIGQQDFSNKLILSQHLYGREKEIKTLESALERVSEGRCEALMVAGQPGVGKTMLIQEIQKSIALKQGYFITGKFDQLNKNVAYSALTQAFNNLIYQWLTEDETTIDRCKNRILESLKVHASLLTKVIPALTLLIGEQPEIAISDINQAKNVFNWIFQKFIKICATAAHPLVIFLDDLQWADQASLALMTYLLQQPNISHLLWIGAYRDTEVTASHPALQTINALQEASIRVQALTLAPLALDSLCQWIADSLHKPLTDIQPLGSLIFQKTGGNPFFVKIFLRSLYDKQLLTFSPCTHWQWDLDKIRQHPATENIITLMSHQIQQLPPTTQQALSIASCLGHRLSLSNLQIAMDCSLDALDRALQPALNSGILVQKDTEIKFAHDRVQEAAYQLLAGAEKARTHLMIGQHLLADPVREEVLLLDIVAQFNHCHSLIINPEMRMRIARLNLQASAKAKQATAYTAGLDYLYSCRNWIDMTALWQNDYPLAFTLHKELAEMEYLSGHMSTSQAIIDDMQPRLQSTLDKVEIFRLLITQKTLQGHYQEAISIGQQALQLLGSALPLDNPDKFIQRELPLLKQRLSSMSLGSLLNTPCIVDPEKRALFKILGIMYGAAYLAGSELNYAVALISINLALKYGLAPESCISYAVYGVSLCVRLEEYALGYEFGKLALQLAEKIHSPIQHCQSSLVILTFVHHWSKPIQQLPALFKATYEACLSCSDLEFAGYCIGSKAMALFNQGASLCTIQQKIIPMLQFAYNTNHQITTYTIQAVQRVLVNLKGDTSGESNFDDNVISEAQFEEGCQQTNSFYALCLYYILKAQTFYLYGCFEKALSALTLAKENLAFISGHYGKTTFNWYDSLARLALYPTVSNEEQQAYVEQVTQNQQQMQKWRASCPENFAHKYLLVEAELARIQGNCRQAETYYNQAIELADRHGFIQEQALAAELAARYWLARDNSLCSQGYLNNAFNAYKQWGAKRKLMQFKAKYGYLLRSMVPTSLSPLNISQDTTLSSNTLKLLDLSSILKASQTISSEIELPKLLHSMMQIIIENAGGQQGALLFVEADDSIIVQAEYARNGTITTLQEIPLADWGNGSHTVIQYAKRLHQSVVLDNAATHDSFKTDFYISQTQAKSILCVPLLKQSELRAILYVENDLMTYAFTPERVHTVLILTAQMAISLENARYVAEQSALIRQLSDQSTRTRIAEESLHALTHDLQLALEASQAGTWNWWLDTNKITWDAAHYALFGLTPSEFKGTYDSVLEYIHPDDQERLDQHLKYCIAQNIPFDMEYRVIWPDESVHILSAQGRVYRDKSGHPIKMAGVCLDITSRRQLEQEQLEATKRVEEECFRRQEALNYQQRQQEQTETVCHELRNPLQGLIGTTDLLKVDMDELCSDLAAYEQRPTPETKVQLDTHMENCKGYVANLEECINHLRDLLDDVLNLAKLEANKMELVIKVIQPKLIIQSVANMFAAEVKKKQIQLNLKVPEEGILVKGDEKRLKQIIINLLANSLKFTDKGGITLGLKILQVTATYTRLQFMVADTGIGMTAEERSRLFERFSQANADITNKYGGTGLGLAISDKLIKLMDGQVEVVSEKGQGTQISFIIECATPTQEELEELENQPDTPTVPVILPNIETPTIKILLVDDKPINQKILLKMLKCLGYTDLKTATNGKEAVQYFTEEGPFNLIFMDIEMPEMNGYEASRQIRQQERALNLESTVIIGLSGHTEEEYRQRAIAAGMNELLSKPFIKENICRVTATWLERAQTIHQQG